MENAFVHDIDRWLIKTDSFQMGYYSAFALAQILAGSVLWLWQMRRGGYSRRFAWLTIPLGLVFLFVGVRLGHCIFYDPVYYFTRPMRILEVWRGGFASHGAALGLTIMFLILSRRYRLSFLDLFDRFTFNGACGSILFRLGNFFNSEVVGRPTDLPWGVRFMFYDDGQAARHPSQLYEALLGLFTLMALFAADRWAGREKRPLGLLFGLSMAIYFNGRFFLEFTKEYEMYAVASPDAILNMGQYLSLPLGLLGIGLVIWSLRERRTAGAPVDRNG